MAGGGCEGSGCGGTTGLMGPGPPPEETGGGWRDEGRAFTAETRTSNIICKYNSLSKSFFIFFYFIRNRERIRERRLISPGSEMPLTKTMWNGS